MWASYRRRPLDGLRGWDGGGRCHVEGVRKKVGKIVCVEPIRLYFVRFSIAIHNESEILFIKISAAK